MMNNQQNPRWIHPNQNPGFQMPGMRPNDDPEIRREWVWIDDLGREILITESGNGVERIGWFRSSCGCLCVFAPEYVGIKHILLQGWSYTDQFTCARHRKFCKICDLPLCVAGNNADGQRWEVGKDTYWYCLEHYKKVRRNAWVQRFMQRLLR